MPAPDKLYNLFSRARGVISDMDGTLTQSSSYWVEIELRTLRSLGVSASREEIRRKRSELVGSQTQAFAAAFYKKTYGLAESVKEIEARIVAIALRIFGEKKVELTPGAWNFLTFLKESGLKTVLASAAPPEILTLVAHQYGLREYFGVFISAKEVGREKPRPDLFLRAAEAIEVEPAQCLVFEDSRWGIEAAKRAGMMSVQVGIDSGGSSPGEQLADVVLPHHFLDIDFQRLKHLFRQRRERKG